MNKKTRPSEELVAAPLPELIRDLGHAIAEANDALHRADSDVVFTIPEAEVEVSVAISVTKSDEIEASGGLNLHAFSVNASYKNTYSFSEQASSRILVRLQAVPRSEPAPATPKV